MKYLSLALAALACSFGYATATAASSTASSITHGALTVNSAMVVDIVKRNTAPGPQFIPLSGASGAPDYDLSLPTTIIAAIVLMVSGAMFTFYGRHLFKTVLFIAGFYVMSIVAFTILVNSEPTDPATGASSWGEKREAIYLGVCLAAGVIGGAIMLVVWRLGLFFIGALGGFALAMFVLGWSSNSAISNDAGRVVFIAALVLGGGILALLFEHRVIIVSTAVAGSFAIIVGIDFFAKTGFATIATSMLQGNANLYRIDDNGVYGMLAGWVIIALFGMLVQFRMTGRLMRDRTYKRKRNNY